MLVLFWFWAISSGLGITPGGIQGIILGVPYTISLRNSVFGVVTGGTTFLQSGKGGTTSLIGWLTFEKGGDLCQKVSLESWKYSSLPRYNTEQAS